MENRGPNVYACQECGYEFRDWHHRNGSFRWYCLKCKRETQFSNSLRETYSNKNALVSDEQVLLID